MRALQLNALNCCAVRESRESLEAWLWPFPDFVSPQGTLCLPIFRLPLLDLIVKDRASQVGNLQLVTRRQQRDRVNYAHALSSPMPLQTSWSARGAPAACLSCPTDSVAGCAVCRLLELETAHPTLSQSLTSSRERGKTDRESSINYFLKEAAWVSVT